MVASTDRNTTRKIAGRPRTAAACSSIVLVDIFTAAGSLATRASLVPPKLRSAVQAKRRSNGASSPCLTSLGLLITPGAAEAGDWPRLIGWTSDVFATSLVGISDGSFGPCAPTAAGAVTGLALAAPRRADRAYEFRAGDDLAADETRAWRLVTPTSCQHQIG